MPVEVQKNRKTKLSDSNSPEFERLHVRIARSGLCSRRAAEELIDEGRVTVNGIIVTEKGTKSSEIDEIAVDGVKISIAKNYTLLFNKPTGYLTTLSDPHGRQTIVKFLPDYGVQLKPVGRLDKETEGLLIITNEGELANRLAHPRYGIDKEYEAIVKGELTASELKKLRSGVMIESGRTKKAHVELVRYEPTTQTTLLRLILHEGKKRQIRLMCLAVGHPVKKLKRTRYGPFTVKGLRQGECRLLGKTEVNQLRALVGLPQQ